MTAVALHRRAEAPTSSSRVHVVIAAAAMVLGTPVLAFLVARGSGVLALPLLLAVPGLVLLARHPMAGVLLWLVIAQLVVQGGGGPERQVYSLVHRLLPLVVLGLVLVAQMVGPQRRTLGRLGWPELAMAGYVVATVGSILHTSGSIPATTMHLFDRVVAPMALYLIVRLLRPGRRGLTLVVGALALVVAVQTAVGLVSWIAPAVLPPQWLGRLGTRTVGSLRHPNVFGTTMLLGGLLALHAAATLPLRRVTRWLATGLGLVAFFMTFMTFGRANWLAGIPVAIGLVVLHPRFALRTLAVGTLAVAVLVMSGLLESQTEQAQLRLRSAAAEESALSRLPVVYGALRMVEARPLTGWGYGNFDKYDHLFQRRVGNVYQPDKDHASHNLYLTILAEQGIPGFALFVFPAAYWLWRTAKRWRRLPASGFVSRKLVGVLWLAALAHVVVNNFSNMRVVYGLGLWWLILGLIASLVGRPGEVGTTASAAPAVTGRRLPDHFRPLPAVHHSIGRR